MRLHDQIRATGALSIQLFDQYGVLKESREILNLVVDTGLAWMAGRQVGTTGPMSHMAIGSGSVAPDPLNTTLGNELGRAALTAQTAAANVAAYASTFAAGVGTGAITEAGIFNANAAGVMLNRATFPVINKGALDTLQINWLVTQH